MSAAGRRDMFCARVDKATALIESLGANQALLTHLPDIRWLTGFTGSNAIAVLGKDRLYFITDGRYRTQSASEVPDAHIEIADNGLFEQASQLFSGKVAIQIDHLTVADKKRVDELSEATQFVETTALFSVLRAEKDPFEVELIRKALSISEQTIQTCLKKLEPGITEREFAAEIDYMHAKLGGEGRAFDTIVAFGAQSALPHARPGSAPLRRGDVVLIDCGCTIGGYASDITRSIVFGEAGADVRNVYSVVKDAMESAIRVSRAGMSTSELDHAARSVIETAGYGDYFVHSLGHGVGLEIHEWPRVGRQTDQTLPDNTMITIEPGIYIPGEFGIRIEEMVLLTRTGGMRLNTSTTDLIELPV